MYLDTNLLFGYGRELARKYKDEKHITEKGKTKKYKTKIKTDNILDKLRKAKFKFITSHLTNYEFIERLREEEGIKDLKICRDILDEIIDEYNIFYCKRKQFNLSEDFINTILRYNLKLLDSLHIGYATKPHGTTMINLMILTNDKKMLKNGKKFYEFIEHPQQIIEDKLKKSK